MNRLNTRRWARAAGPAALSALLTLGAAGCSKQAAAPGAPEAKEAATKAGGAAANAKADAAANPAGKVPAGAKVFFTNLKDGQVVEGMAKDGLIPVHIDMGVSEMNVQPAGEIVEGTGHHHIIIDAPATQVGMPVKKDEQHIHFGKGETAADIHVKPGVHTLTLQFANGAHLSYGPKLAASIKITAKAMPAAAQGDKPASADVALEPPAVAPAGAPPAVAPEPDPNAKPAAAK